MLEEQGVSCHAVTRNCGRYASLQTARADLLIVKAVKTEMQSAHAAAHARAGLCNSISRSPIPTHGTHGLQRHASYLLRLVIPADFLFHTASLSAVTGHGNVGNAVRLPAKLPHQLCCEQCMCILGRLTFPKCFLIEDLKIRPDSRAMIGTQPRGMHAEVHLCMQRCTCACAPLSITVTHGSPDAPGLIYQSFC